MAGLLAPDGRCKSFDASGDGYGRGEGFAAVILKLTDAAFSDKDEIYCEIVSCAMNNDGQNAVPITAPSAKMQAALSRTVLDESGLSPRDIDYFEAHGTGTAIGDVIETNSIAETYCEKREGGALRIGSVKSNLNHTESTSGLAGLIKVALMIEQQTYVPTINVRTLNPKLKLDQKGIALQQKCEYWSTRNGKPRIAAINSFGYGGTNVHAILREPAKRLYASELSRKQSSHNRPSRNVMTLSAQSRDALRDMARVYADWLNCNTEGEAVTADLCYSLNERRSQHSHRLAVAFENFKEASDALTSFTDEKPGWEKLASYGEAKTTNQTVVFMFGGQGAQWYAMGRQLIANEPIFREAINQVGKLLRDFGKGWSLLDVLSATEKESKISENPIAQPATFAIQYATAELLKSWGVFPSAVLGHSLGEFAAACTAGCISLKEAVKLVLIRSELQEKCSNNGAMAALGMSEEITRDLLMELRLDRTLNIAAVNDAKSVTVAGDAASVEILGNHVSANHAGVFWRVLGTTRAFHSFHMDAIKKPFKEAVQNIALQPRLSVIPMYSTVSGDVISGKQLNSSYWWNNIRCPVQFCTAVKHLLRDEHKLIIEISSQPILAHYVKQIALQENYPEKSRPVVLATLPRKRVPLREQHKFFLQNTTCQLYTQGFALQWSRIQGNQDASFIRLPTYPWQEKQYWYRDEMPPGEIQPLEEGSLPGKDQCWRHPFLGEVRATRQFSGESAEVATGQSVGRSSQPVELQLVIQE